MKCAMNGMNETFVTAAELYDVRTRPMTVGPYHDRAVGWTEKRRCQPPRGKFVTRHAYAVIFLSSSSVKRLAQGEAAVTLYGSIFANNLDECPPLL